MRNSLGDFPESIDLIAGNKIDVALSLHARYHSKEIPAAVKEIAAYLKKA